MTDGNDSIARRDLIRNVSAAMLGAMAAPALAQQAAPGSGHVMKPRYPGPRPTIAMLAYPNMVLLDLIGPMTIFNILEFDIHLVWKDKTPGMTEVRVPITPTTTFAECPRDLDVLFVPGGSMGTVNCMNDPEVMAFIADRGSRAKYVTSVCTGAMVLGAAGLLKGYKAATLWMLMDYLPIVGAIPVHDRVVKDRNRITGGGVTAGIDFGLSVGAIFRGQAEAERAQLIVEYAPEPPFNSGTPKTADPKLAKAIMDGRPGLNGMIETAARNAAKSWKTGA